jgi:hypothetical protein
MNNKFTGVIFEIAISTIIVTLSFGGACGVFASLVAAVACHPLWVLMAPVGVFVMGIAFHLYELVDASYDAILNCWKKRQEVER